MKLKIEKLIFEGFGLGHDDRGRAVFVRKSVPGDELEVKPIKEKSSYVEAIVEKIEKPSSFRAEPICPHFDKCGGCEHMNIPYNNQVEFKGKIFRETLGRAKINKMPLEVIPGSGDQYYYRNSIRFFFINEPNGISFARHNYIYDEGLVKVEKCYLQSETTNDIMLRLKKVIDENVQDKSLFWQLKIREGKFTNEFMIEIITSGDTLPGEQQIVEELKNIPEIKSIYHTIAPAKSLKNLKRRLIFGSPIIYEKIGKFTFQISPESFFQTNSLGVHTLYDKIKEFAEVKIGESVLDLYCGTGTIGIYLSTLAKKVVGVEVVPQAIRDAKDNAKINKVHNCDFLCEDAEKFLIKNRDKFDVIIVDPPRAGLSRKTVEILSKVKSRIVYTSCNPATFARDVKIFEELGRKLDKVQPIDMFPQTHHIECVGVIK